MKFTLPERKFEFVDFEPVIDAKTMEIHFTKHHQAYVDNLNKAMETEGSDKLLGGKSDQIEALMYLLSHLDDVPTAVKTAVTNNAGGHFNHCMWWDQIAKPTDNAMPSDTFISLLNKYFGSFDTFKEQFSQAAMTRFGSGWAWLVWDKKNEKLVVMSSANQDNPLIGGMYPLLGLDVWEHAYYLQYQNKRVEYVNNFWKIINWKVVEGYYSYFSKM